ncbi:MAG: prepilin peptidase [Aquabacterium sp.]
MSLVPDVGGLDTWSERLLHGTQVPRPGPVYGAYPLKDIGRRSTSPLIAWLQARWRAPAMPSRAQNRRFLAEVKQARAHWAGMDAQELAHHVVALRVKLGTQGFTAPLSAQGFGLVSWAVQQHMGFALHDVQLLAAWWMLGQRLVEMATGEGKTLTVLLTAATAALAGVPVHVLTANDYLARRDAEQLAPIYASLGLSVSFVTASSTPDERKQAYLADVVHVTAKEVAFDHLRDRAARAVGDAKGMVLRGLCMAVVDEADGILIDEACTPLILARATDLREADQRYRMSLFLARQLKNGTDFICNEGLQVRLTQAGEDRLKTLSASMQGEWTWQRYRHTQVLCALQALHAFQRDVHYLVRDNDIHIIDETTGRLAVGRSWSRGLHQMIAIKESVKPKPENETLSQTSYQSFFPRYLRLAGLSGTLYEDRAEMLRVYNLPMCRVPLRVASKRVIKPALVCADAASKWARVAHSAMAESKKGRPVLIGTDTVADSDAISRVLTSLGAAHQILNARQDEEKGEQERGVIAQAGQPGHITVATHMAGRGTDIHLDDVSLRQGGLHVINTNLNKSRRIDRQLIGRCARQGTPGSCETILSWEDACFDEFADRGWRHAAVGWGRHGWLPGLLARWVCDQIQDAAEARSRRKRWGMLLTEASMARQLALAGSEDWD